MHMKLNLVSILTAISVLGMPIAACAQNPQSWLTNEASKIQGDYGSGQINQQQAGRLQQGTQRILTQEQQEMAKNGGFLTPQQQGQLNSEIRGLNSERRRDVQNDNPGAYNNGAYPQQYPGNGQYYGNQGGYPVNGYNSNFTPYQGQPPYGAQNGNWQNNQQILNNGYNQYGQPYQNQQGYPQGQPGQSGFSIPFLHRHNSNN
jgi:hypothetical protein